jgi:Phosphoenolpyruvate carboxylase
MLQVGARGGAGLARRAWTRALSALTADVNNLTVQDGAVSADISATSVAAVQNDVRQLGGVLGKTIQAHSPAGVFEHVEEIRSLSRNWSASGSRDSMQALVAKVNSLSALDLKLVSKAFAHFLALANCAESFHRWAANHMSYIHCACMYNILKGHG